MSNLTMKPLDGQEVLQKIIYQSMRLNTQIDLKDDRRLQGSQLAWAGYAANSVLNAGYTLDRSSK